MIWNYMITSGIGGFYFLHIVNYVKIMEAILNT